MRAAAAATRRRCAIATMRRRHHDPRARHFGARHLRVCADHGREVARDRTVPWVQGSPADPGDHKVACRIGGGIAEPVEFGDEACTQRPVGVMPLRDHGLRSTRRHVSVKGQNAHWGPSF